MFYNTNKTINGSFCLFFVSFAYYFSSVSLSLIGKRHILKAERNTSQ